MNTLSMYQKALGDDYARLPAAVQTFHRLSGHTAFNGWVETQGPQTILAKVLAACLGTPRSSSSGPIRFELSASPAEETWTRHFPAQAMTSCMRLVDGHIEERLGAAQLTFDLLAAEDKLSMRLARMRFLGMPCPRWLMPGIVAEERGADDQIHFLVTAELPLVGVVASYRGYLDVSKKESA